MRIKEVTVFSSGDSTKLKTWANVPFLFVEALIQNGVKVNRVNIEPDLVPRAIYKILLHPLIRLFNPRNVHYYYRTWINHVVQWIRVQRAIAKYPDSQVNIFIPFGFAALGGKGQLCIEFGDWTYDYHFRYFDQRKPDLLECRGVDREDKVLSLGDYLFSLFPGVAQYMRGRYGEDRVKYLGNVINSVVEPVAKQWLALKRERKRILFVGSVKYRDGAKLLLEAFQELQKRSDDMVLDVIGMSGEEFSGTPAAVRFHGYLDKGQPEQRKTYYDLMSRASVFVNPSQGWGSFSACIEAMHHYTPVIVAPYSEFVATFGLGITFGEYVTKNEPVSLADQIEGVLQSRRFDALCSNAHESVRDFTWKDYVAKMLDVLNSARRL